MYIDLISIFNYCGSKFKKNKRISILENKDINFINKSEKIKTVETKKFESINSKINNAELKKNSDKNNNEIILFDKVSNYNITYEENHNLNNTPITIFNNLNSFSSQSTLDINNLQSLFEYAPANSPTFTNGTQVTINDTDYYIQFLTNGTITIPTNMVCDCLIVGAGGRGGLNAYAGGGGAGEVIYYPSFNFVSGVYYVNVGVDSATTTNRESILHKEGTKYLNAIGGGEGGNGADLTLSPFVPKSWTSSTAEVATRTINGRTCTGRDITLNSTGIYYGVGTYELYYSSTRYAMDNVGNPYALFNFDYTPGTAGFGGTFRANNYSAATGLTTTLGNTYYMPDINYKGDWCCVSNS